MSVVYFIQEGAAGPIKIGFTSSIKERMATLSAATANPLSLIDTVPGGMSLEKRLHRHLAVHRYRNEWFHPHRDVLAALDALKAGRELPPISDDWAGFDDCIYRQSVAEMLERLVARHGLRRVVWVAGCDERTIRNAREKFTVFSPVMLFRLMLLDPSALDELLGVFGLQATSLGSAQDVNIQTAHALLQEASRLISGTPADACKPVVQGWAGFVARKAMA